MKQQICNCHKFHTGPCPIVIKIDPKSIQRASSTFIAQTAFLQPGEQEKLIYTAYGTNDKPKKPSILQQIKDFIGQIGCDLS